MICITNGKCIGQGKLKWHFRLCIIPHGLLFFISRPTIHASIVPCIQSIIERMGRTIDSLGIADTTIEMIRAQ
ncbi:hypothetical protein D3C76_1078030 [compost metagenome]